MTSESPTTTEISSAFITNMRDCLSEGMRKIEHCVSQLSDQQIWWRPRPEMNSMANLMLHLSGNLRQWIISGVGGAMDIRQRPLEFSDHSNRPKAEVIGILKKTVEEADAVLAALKVEQLLSPRRIQAYNKTVLAAIIDTISHFRGHVQEIIHMTREQLGEKYKYDFVPTKAQESASAP